MVERQDVSVDVSDLRIAGTRNIAVRLVAMPGWDGDVVLCCFPGGGMSSRYFELERFDMATHVATAGVGMLLVDHPGVGGSDVPDDPWLLTPELVADVDVVATTRALEALDLHAATRVGLGHSMGAMLVAYQQARHGLYAGVVLAGFSGRGLPEVLTPSEQAVAGSAVHTRAVIVDLARERFATALVDGSSATLEMLVGPDLSARAREAIDHSTASLLAVCGLNALIPGSDAEALKAVDVPVLLAVAEHDIVGPPHEAPAYMTGSHDVTLYVVPGAFHNSNIAPARRELWDRIITWVRTIAVPAGRAAAQRTASPRRSAT